MNEKQAIALRNEQDARQARADNAVAKPPPMTEEQQRAALRKMLEKRADQPTAAPGDVDRAALNAPAIDMVEALPGLLDFARAPAGSEPNREWLEGICVYRERAWAATGGHAASVRVAPNIAEGLHYPEAGYAQRDHDFPVQKLAKLERALAARPAWSIHLFSLRAAARLAGQGNVGLAGNGGALYVAVGNSAWPIGSCIDPKAEAGPAYYSGALLERACTGAPSDDAVLYFGEGEYPAVALVLPNNARHLLMPISRDDEPDSSP